jgi:hypothetical protein
MDNIQLVIILPILGLFISLIILWQKRRNQKISRHIESLFLDAASIPSFRNSIGHLNKELSRARRSHSPLSIIVIEHRPTESRFKSMHQIDSSTSPIVINRRKESDITDFLLCGKVIREALRDIDITSYAAANNQFIIVMPESTKFEAENAIKRIKKIIGMGASHLHAEVAEFPNDGLILDDLVAHAANLISNRDSVSGSEDTITEW